VIGGLGLKIAAVPFHFWAPDVYQGSPTPITAFLSVVSKAAGFAAIYRVLLPLFAVEGQVIPDDILAIRGALVATIREGHLPLLFWILSAATMTVGNLVAIRQTDLKRLLAYSSIAHAGYLLMGLTVYNHAALEAMLFYFFAYYLMNLGAFLVVIVMINKTGRSDIESYRGLVWKNPFIAITMFIFLISLTGLPPTIGFIGKLKLFYVVVGAGVADIGPVLSGTAIFYLSLALIGGINTAISLYYYMRIAKVMVFSRPKEEGPLTIPTFERFHLLAYMLPVLLLIIQFSPIDRLVELFQR
jgi:NADH-quinone oxidoreductase subunit N